MFHWENHACLPRLCLILLLLTTTYVPFIIILEPLYTYVPLIMHVFSFLPDLFSSFFSISNNIHHTPFDPPPFHPTWSPRCKGQDFQEMWQQKDVTLTNRHGTTPLCGRIRSVLSFGNGGMWDVWKLGERGKLEVRGWEVEGWWNNERYHKWLTRVVV